MKARIPATTETTLAKKLFRLLSMGAVMGLLAGSSASAAFKGHFAPHNWKLTTNEASVTLDLAMAPQQITFICAGGTGGEARWSITMPLDGELGFDWQYTPDLDNPVRDHSAGYSSGETSVTLASPGSAAERGRASIAVKAGEPFAFWIQTAGKSRAPGRLTIRNFTYNGIPRIRNMAVASQDVQVAFDSVPGRLHRVQACNDLNTRQWVDVSPDILAADANTFYSMARRAGDTMFFRILLLPEVQ